MWLLIDDLRDLHCDLNARTAAEGKRLLQEHSAELECVCLDHDLGEVETGYDVALWALERDLMPSHVQLVTSNPVGRKNMADCLKAYKYSTLDGVNFYKR